MRKATAVAIVVVALGVAGCGGSRKTTTGAAKKTAAVSTTATGTATGQAANPETTPSAVNAGNASGTVVPVVAVSLYHPLAQYTVRTDALIKQLQPQIASLQSAAADGDLATAEQDWLRAHTTWLKVGQDDAAYGAFGQLGQNIDGLAAGLQGTTASPQFTGFHRIEFELWQRRDTQAAATDSAQLAHFVAKLTPKSVAGDLPISVRGLDTWILRCHEILEDALRDALSGDDDYGSNSDLSTLSADVSATREMLTVLTPQITPRAPQLVPAATRELATLTRAINAAGGPRRSVPLSALPVRKRQNLDADASAALETLAPVSDLLFITNPGS